MTDGALDPTRIWTRSRPSARVVKLPGPAAGTLSLLAQLAAEDPPRPVDRLTSRGESREAVGRDADADGGAIAMSVATSDITATTTTRREAA
ncbi:MAG: hypothetical protein JWM05_3275 [Acidimicrobiales bacterium]|nr:hypothetical protein [Acidimicrobiales bacterium]